MIRLRTTPHSHLNFAKRWDENRRYSKVTDPESCITEYTTYTKKQVYNVYEEGSIQRIRRSKHATYMTTAYAPGYCVARGGRRATGGCRTPRCARRLTFPESNHKISVRNVSRSPVYSWYQGLAPIFFAGPGQGLQRQNES